MPGAFGASAEANRKNFLSRSARGNRRERPRSFTRTTVTGFRVVETGTSARPAKRQLTGPREEVRGGGGTATQDRFDLETEVTYHYNHTWNCVQEFHMVMPPTGCPLYYSFGGLSSEAASPAITPSVIAWVSGSNVTRPQKRPTTSDRFGVPNSSPKLYSISLRRDFQRWAFPPSHW